MLHINHAEYIEDYKIKVSFDDSTVKEVDFKNKIYSDKREIVQELKDIELFKSFKIQASTITWPNGLDFAPEAVLSIPNNY